MSIFKQRLLFVGVGQAGGNIANLFQKKGYYAAYINTSPEDLSTLNTDKANIFHIPTASGCSKDKKKAKKYILKYYKDMVTHIEGNYPNQDIVIFIFSAGGGTGAGLAPMLLDYLSEHKEEKNYDAILVLPSDKETSKCLKNACETYSEVTAIKHLKALFTLDNSRGDKLAINKKFVDLFDEFLNLSNSTSLDGNIDKNEVETLLTTKGAAVLLKGAMNNGEVSLINEVFPEDIPRGCDFIGMTCKENRDAFQDTVQDIVGYPEDVFEGVNDASNMALVVGMNYPDSMIQNYVDVVTERESGKNADRDGSAIITNPFAKEKSKIIPDGQLQKNIIVSRKNPTKEAQSTISKWL